MTVNASSSVIERTIFFNLLPALETTVYRRGGKGGRVGKERGGEVPKKTYSSAAIVGEK